MKRAQGLPLNVVVLAAIALLVLVLLSVVVVQRTGIFTKGVSETGEAGVSNVCDASVKGRICSETALSQAEYKVVNAKIGCESSTAKCYEPVTK